MRTCVAQSCYSGRSRALAPWNCPGTLCWARRHFQRQDQLAGPFSGLEFPLNKANKQRLTRDVSSTRYADCIFRRAQPVLIDTPGAI